MKIQNPLLLFSLILTQASAFALPGPDPAADADTQVAAATSSKRKTLTYTATSTVTASTTVTGTTTLYTTTTFTRPYAFPVFHNIYTGTVTSTYTSLTSTFTTIKPKSTTSVPTVKGFTPLLSVSYYTDKVIVKRTTVTVTSTSTFDPSPVTTVGDFTMVYNGTTDITTTTDSTFFVETVQTSTSTARPSVHTAFAGCRPDNLATKIPTGQLINNIGQYADTDYDAFDTDNAADCCMMCHAHPGCFGGGWDSAPDKGTCFIFFLSGRNASETCNGKRSYGIFSSEAENEPGYRTTAFNGPCGQLQWNFVDADYFK